MPGVVAHGEPHLAADDKRLERERMHMRVQRDVGVPTSLDHLVEPLGSRVRFEIVEVDSAHDDLRCVGGFARFVRRRRFQSKDRSWPFASLRRRVPLTQDGGSSVLVQCLHCKACPLRLSGIMI